MTHIELQNDVRLDVLANEGNKTNVQFTLTYPNVRSHASNIEIRFYDSGNIKLTLWQEGVIMAAVELSEEEAKEVEKTVKEHSKDSRKAITVHA